MSVAARVQQQNRRTEVGQLEIGLLLAAVGLAWRLFAACGATRRTLKWW